MTRSRRPKVTTPTQERHSIRVVTSSTRSSLADRRTMEDKRSSYIRKRASAQSPFFSAGYRASSSTYRSPPAFIAETTGRVEKKRRSRNFIMHSRANTIVKPDDDVEEGKGKEIPGVPSEGKTESKFPGSLRKHRSTKSLREEAGKAKSPPPLPRPATTVAATGTGMIRRASTRKSLLASGLKASLNDLTGSEIYDNADLSESVYTDEEDDIDDYSKRTTVKPGQFTLPPLNLDSRKSPAREKRRSKRDSQPKKKDRELKRTSEREPTPHYLAREREHGGKENMSSTHTLGKIKITPIPEAKATPRAALSPVRTNAARRSSQTLALPRRSALRDTPLSRAHSPAPSTTERHSRRSQHSLTSAAKRTPHTKPTHSRSQSSAFPFFDPSSLAESSSPGSNPATSPAPRASRSWQVRSRDLSGNLVFRDSSSGFVSVAPSAAPPSVAPPPLPLPRPVKRNSNVPSGVPGSRQSGGLGLFPAGAARVGVVPEREEKVASVGGGGEGAGTERERETAAKEKGRRTWGEGLKSVLGRGSVWGWERERDDVKVFV